MAFQRINIHFLSNKNSRNRNLIIFHDPSNHQIYNCSKISSLITSDLYHNYFKLVGYD